MILATTDVIQGVYGANALRDFFAGIRDIIGGRTGSYERVFERGHRDALAELEQRARALGANAVLGIKIDTGSIEVGETGTLLLVTASGTAIRLREG
jgi:uncharacterized protein YbjQ (UPF0145 family)